MFDKYEVLDIVKVYSLNLEMQYQSKSGGNSCKQHYLKLDLTIDLRTLEYQLLQLVKKKPITSKSTSTNFRKIESSVRANAVAVYNDYSKQNIYTSELFTSNTFKL